MIQLNLDALVFLRYHEAKNGIPPSIVVTVILMARSFSDKYLTMATIGKMMEAIPAIGRNKTMPTSARAPLIKPYHVAP